MRKIIALFLFLFLYGAAFGQLSQFRMIGSGSWTTVNDSTFSSTVTIQSDLTSNGFLPTSITTGEKIFSQTGQRYRISIATGLTFSSADLTIVESGGDWGAPVGQVMIYDPDGRTAVPSIPFGATGATAKMQEAIDSYNSIYILSADELADSTAAVRADFPSGGGATAFTDLTDSPANYTGQANKMALVNPGETGLIFVDTAGLGGGGGSDDDWIIDNDTIRTTKSVNIQGSAFLDPTSFLEIPERLAIYENGLNGTQNYFFGSLSGWSAANGDAANSAANNFHFWVDDIDDIRVEFENNTGPMQFYIEGDGEAWFGLQDTSAHEWSIGIESAIRGTDIMWNSGFGLDATPAMALSQVGDLFVRTDITLGTLPNFYAYSSGNVYARSSLNVGVTSHSYPFEVSLSDAGLLGRFYNTNGAGRGLVLLGGNGVNNPDLLKVQKDGGDTAFQINADGDVVINDVSGSTTPLDGLALDIRGTTKGIRIPRLTTTQKNAISTPQNSMLLFDTSLDRLQWYQSNSSTWRGWGETSYFTYNSSLFNYRSGGSAVPNLHTSISAHQDILFEDGDDDMIVQIASENAGSVGSAILFSNQEDASNGHHWLFQNRGITRNNDFTFGYYLSTADDQNIATGSTDFLIIKTDGQVNIPTSGGTATTLTGRDAEEDITDVTIGSGLTLSSGTLSVNTPSEAFMSVVGGATSFVAGTPERIDGDTPGTTTDVTSSTDMTVASSRITYTGAVTKNFHVIGAISSATATASEMTYFVAINGVTVGTGKRRDHSNTDTGYIGVQWVVSLSTNDYVEIYVDAVANETTDISTYNITVKEW